MYVRRRQEEPRWSARFGRSLTPSSKVLGGFWGEKIKNRWRLIVHQLQKIGLGGLQGEWNIDQFWFRCRNVLGRHGKVRGAVGTWDSSHGQNSSPRDRRGKGNVLKRENGPLASKYTCFASFYRHFQGLLEKEEMVRSCLTFSTPQTWLNFGKLEAGGEG